MKNEFIKQANTEIEFTSEQIEELKKCANDPIYFISNYCYIQNQVDGKVKFNLRPYQKRIIDSLHKNRFNVLLIGRQCGKCLHSSTIINTCLKPVGFKKILLRIFFPSQYKIMFND